jgi:hypothetical protein
LRSKKSFAAGAFADSVTVVDADLRAHMLVRANDEGIDQLDCRVMTGGRRTKRL